MDSCIEEYNNAEILIILCAAGAEITTATLRAASELGHIDAVKYAIEEQVDLDESDDANTAIVLAAHKGHTEIVDLLIKAGVDVNPRQYRVSALYVSATLKHYDITRLLLKADAETNHDFEQLILDNHADAVKIFIEEDKSIVNRMFLDKYEKEYYSPLMIAALKGFAAIAKILIEADADMCVTTSRRETALMMAVQNNHTSIVKLILESATQECIDMRDDCEHSALNHAVSNFNSDIVQLLLNSCANLDGALETAIQYKRYNFAVMIVDEELNRNGETSLELNSPEAVHVLDNALDMSYDDVVNLFEGVEMRNLFFQHCINGELSYVNTLLELGADVNTKDNNGHTPLIMVITNNHTDVAELLIRKGANINAQNNIGQTALMIAVINNHLESVKLLLAASADVNLMTATRNTALIYATYAHREHLIQILLEAGADPNHTNNFGVKALPR